MNSQQTASAHESDTQASDPQESRRIAALHKLRVLDTPPDPQFDSLTRLAARLTGAPVCLISLVDSDRQFFKSAHGLPPHLATVSETPLSHSFCKHVVFDRETLQVDDSRKDPRVAENLAVEELGVSAYLGAPIVDPVGNVLGSACVIDHKPRRWSDTDKEIMKDIAQLAMTEFSHIESANRALEQAAGLEEKNQQLRTAISTLAHDLKNPLSTVIFASAMMKEKIAPDDALSPLVSMVAESADKLNGQIEDTLERSHSEHLGSKRELKPVDLASFVKVSVDFHGASLTRKQMDASIEIEAEQTQFLADETALSEVLDNLISNSIKFSKDGSQISLTVTQDGLIIRDQGPGFTADDLKKVFKRFMRLSARSTAGESSSGLGLAICKQLVEEMDGEIRCISAPGEPAAFQITLRPHA